MTTQLCYVGEVQDYSDRWLIQNLSDLYKIRILSPGMNAKDMNPEDQVWINRLYVSSVQRHGQEKIKGLLKLIRAAKFKINSDRGFLLESERKQQSCFFDRHGIKYVPTFTGLDIKNNLWRDKKFPVIVKANLSGRNKVLPIAFSDVELSQILSKSSEGKFVVQPLVQDTICYRTEFVGRYSWTYRQFVSVNKRILTFSKEEKIVENPADKDFYRKLQLSLNNMCVRCFSVEYFISEGEPLVVDFNMTSNYSEKLIGQIGPKLINAWKEIIQNEIK